MGAAERKEVAATENSNNFKGKKKGTRAFVNFWEKTFNSRDRANENLRSGLLPISSDFTETTLSWEKRI